MSLASIYQPPSRTLDQGRFSARSHRMEQLCLLFDISDSVQHSGATGGGRPNAVVIHQNENRPLSLRNARQRPTAPSKKLNLRAAAGVRDGTLQPFLGRLDVKEIAGIIQRGFPRVRRIPAAGQLGGVALHFGGTVHCSGDQTGAEAGTGREVRCEQSTVERQIPIRVTNSPFSRHAFHWFFFVLKSPFACWFILY